MPTSPSALTARQEYASNVATVVAPLVVLAAYVEPAALVAVAVGAVAALRRGRA